MFVLMSVKDNIELLDRYINEFKKEENKSANCHLEHFSNKTVLAVKDDDNVFYDNEDFKRYFYTGEIVPNLEDAPSGEYVLYNRINNTLNIFTDPLGFRKIFYFKNDSLLFISDLFEVVHDFIINYTTYKLTLNYNSFLMSLFVGNSFIPETGLDEIKIVDKDEYLSLNFSDISDMKKIKRNYFNFANEVASRHIRYEDLLNDAIERLNRHLYGILDKNKNRELIVECTGGYDSRMVLSLILSNRLTNFKICTFGDSHSHDQKFSKLVRLLFGINPIRYSSDINKIEFAKNNFIKCCGSFNPIDQSYLSSYRIDDYFILGGAGGEYTRGYFAKITYDRFFKGRFVDFEKSTYSEQFYYLMSCFALQSFLNDDFKHMISNQAATFYSDYMFSRSLLMLLDYSYFSSRSRWHFGEQMHNRQKNFIQTYCLLNDFVFHSLVFGISAIGRMTDENVSNLIMKTYPFLDYFPNAYENPFKPEKDLLRNMITLPYIEYEETQLNIDSKSAGPNKINKSDYNDLENLFLALLDDNHTKYLLNKAAFKNFTKSKNKLTHLLKFSPLLYWYDHFK